MEMAFMDRDAIMSLAEKLIVSVLQQVHSSLCKCFVGTHADSSIRLTQGFMSL